MTSLDLARCIQIAIRGFSAVQPNVGVLEDLDRMVRLLVAGAVAPRATRKSRSA
jgi:hypothetical protein